MFIKCVFIYEQDYAVSRLRSFTRFTRIWYCVSYSGPVTTRQCT